MYYIFTGMKPFKTLFLPMVIMFYIFASFKLQIRITKYTDFAEAKIESGWGGGLCRLKRTIPQVSGKINYHRIE